MVLTGSGPATPDAKSPDDSTSSEFGVVVHETEAKVYDDHLVSLIAEGATEQQKKADQKKKKQDEKAPKYIWEPPVLASLVWSMGGCFIVLSRDEL